MNKTYFPLFGILGMIILVGLIFFFEKNLNKSHISLKNEEFVSEKLAGVVNTKYIDSSNHNAETIELLSQNPYVMFRDGTDFFKFIQKGDSIFKSQNTDTVNVYRRGQEYKFKIIF